ncbi:polysaccharide deacetylase family protein [Constantimarinum furrinae]|uniref:Polysaccharide deacetylase n=1 Tax=Constantimarinum furrinae TaxID=2562285 RepID=A0A7G8PVI9_9FLAO|nr:polysaccharide deacetylase family protein [Constantimarinum furrinae]QNJ98355.1 Polysaccharide deacetylase [Constantimarinum furrinae]
MSKLPVLMYHNVSLTESKGLTINVKKLEAQFQYLSDKKYRSYHFSELMSLDQLPAQKNVVITFDDAYVSQLEYAVPLLKKYELKATFFVPLYYLGKTDAWNTATLPIMTAEQLHLLDPSVIELGYHSYAHQKYDELSVAEIEADTKQCFEAVDDHSLEFTKVLAYPYGKYPREHSAKKLFFEQLKQEQFQLGLRIGNRINVFPFKDPFEIQRLDIKGEYSLGKFKRKLKFGKFL